jgi:hypothetical protein
MNTKGILYLALAVLLGMGLFASGVVVGALRAHNVCLRDETLFVLPTTYRAYRVLESGDTERAKFLYGSLLATYTEKYDSLFPTGSQSARFEKVLTGARQISQAVRTNTFRRQLELKAEAEE